MKKTHVEQWTGQAGKSLCGEAGPVVMAAMRSDCDACRKLAGIAPVHEAGVRAAPKAPPAQVTADEVLEVLRALSREGAKEHDTVGRRLAEAFDKLDLMASDRGEIPTPWRRA